jgi:hypothetical protein
MTTRSYAPADTVPALAPRPVSDRRLAALDLTGGILAVVMALGPLTAYALIGG